MRHYGLDWCDVKYRNSLYFRCKNTFVHRKLTKIFYANKFYNKNFSVGWLRTIYIPALPELLLPICSCIR